MGSRRRSSGDSGVIGGTIDPVTGLGDDGSFHGALGVARDEEVTLFLVDLDGFGLVNEAHGREVGDRYLRKAAAILSRGTRGDDFLARIAGDRFAIVSPGCDEVAAPSVARRIRATLFAEGLRACVGHATAAAGEPLTATMARAQTSLEARKLGTPITA